MDPLLIILSRSYENWCQGILFLETLVLILVVLSDLRLYDIPLSKGSNLAFKNKSYFSLSIFQPNFIVSYFQHHQSKNIFSRLECMNGIHEQCNTSYIPVILDYNLQYKSILDYTPTINNKIQQTCIKIRITTSNTTTQNKLHPSLSLCLFLAIVASAVSIQMLVEIWTRKIICKQVTQVVLARCSRSIDETLLILMSEEVNSCIHVPGTTSTTPIFSILTAPLFSTINGIDKSTNIPF